MTFRAFDGPKVMNQTWWGPASWAAEVNLLGHEAA